jgi:hypothetical protein
MLLSAVIYVVDSMTDNGAKHRISLGQEFVVAGYVPSDLGLDSLGVGFIAERISYTPPAFEQASSLQPGGRCSRESNTSPQGDGDRG